jgi:fatty acid CoA ligase FadD9
MFTRLLFSLAVTGIAPVSFYAPAADGSRARGHYDGMPVDFLAAAIRALGAQPWHGFRTFNTISAHVDDGVSLDTIADWVTTGGYPIARIADHVDWARRFADRMRNLPDDQRQHSALPVMGYVEHPHAAEPAGVRNDAFVAALQALPGAPEVPGLSEAFIHKYLDDLRLLGVLPAAS